MAHFARIDQQGVVIEVQRIDDVVLGDLPFPDSEPVGQAFQASLGLEGTWRQCSYSASFRAHYPGPGYTYDPDLDVFVPPAQPEPETPAQPEPES